MITVLTPTYNRSHTLARLFDSLVKQTHHEFEWLVIDDGSTDATSEIVAGFQARMPPFSIRFFTQVNGGKHSAINSGVERARGDWVFIVDSDDILTADAIMVAHDAISTLPNSGVVGICFRKAHFDGKMIGVTCRLSETVKVMHPTWAGKVLMGDLAYLLTRHALHLFPFPIINGEKFVPELYVWNQIGDIGEIHFFLNKIIYLCEYLPDGYSRNFSSNLRRNCRGFQLFYKSQFFRETTLKSKLKCLFRIVQCELYVLLRKFA